jgi:hypothetical protein
MSTANVESSGIATGESSGIAPTTRSGTAERAERDTEPCAAPAPVLYDSLLEELHAARVAAGGTLPDASESAFAERLDDLWWQMTDEEQDAWNARTP